MSPRLHPLAHHYFIVQAWECSVNFCNFRFLIWTMTIEDNVTL